ncbi:MAG: hypothetical protein WC969_10335 [Elusimicrobiota bacterium]|jgi:hypothetical protein
MKRTALCALLLAAGPLWAGETPFTVTDAQGGFYSVSNRSDGLDVYMHVKRLDATGALLWEDWRRSVGSDLQAATVAADPSGHLLITSLRGRGGSRVMNLIRYRLDGSVDWETDFTDGGRNVPTALAADRDGNIYVGGRVLRDGRSIARIWKYDRFGTLRWNREYADASNSALTQLQVDIHGNLIAGVEVYSGSAAAIVPSMRVALVYDSGGSRVSIQ